MKLVWIGLAALTLNPSAWAVNLAIPRQDMKLATQKVLENVEYDGPVAADADFILNDQATSASATTTVTTFLSQPDVCRALSITPGGSTAEVNESNVIVSGYNAIGGAITESIAMPENQASVVTGSKAFCSVTSIVFGQMDGPSATFDVGVREVLGLNRCMDAEDVVYATFAGAREGTHPTVTKDSTIVERNTVDLNSALNGSGDASVKYIQNYRCLP